MTFGGQVDVGAIERAARELFQLNHRAGEYRGRHYDFTVPSPRSYPWQWYWDSCFHAIVRSRWDPAGACAELETLLAAAEPDGFIGHIVFWGRPIDLKRAVRYNIAARHDLMTRTIQPPLLAFAWSLAVGDPAGHPGIERHHAWLRNHRDLDGDGLIWIIQGDESGMDASPKFDHVWGRLSQGLTLFPVLIARNRRLGFDAHRVDDAGHPVVCEVVTNVAHCLSELALGRPSLTPRLVARLWDDDAGRFFDDVRHARHPTPGPSRPRTWDTLAPLALPDLPEPIARRLVDHVLRSSGHAGAVPVPAVEVDDPAHTSQQVFGPLRRHRHWRGPSWVNSAWLVSLGLRRLGEHELAADVAARVAAVWAREGFREYYEARTGQGMGARDFAWSTLLLELVDPRADRPPRPPT